MVLRFLGEATTDENGLAVLSDGYTGTGAGEIDVVAKTEIDDRIIQSTPYEVLDCIYFDDCSTDTTANYYVNTITNSIAYDSTNKMIKLTGLSSNPIYFDIRTLTSVLIGNTVNIEVDVVLNGNEVRLRVLKNGNSLMNTAYTNADGTLKLENVDLTGSASYYYIRVESRNTSADDTFSFKNLKIYPV